MDRSTTSLILNNRHSFGIGLGIISAEQAQMGPGCRHPQRLLERPHQKIAQVAQSVGRAETDQEARSNVHRALRYR